MKKFFKTTVVLELVTNDAPLGEVWLADFLDSIADNCDLDIPIAPEGRIQASKSISSRAAAAVISNTSLEFEYFGIDEDGNDLDEEEE